MAREHLRRSVPARRPGRHDPFAPGLPHDAHWPRAGSWLRRESADHVDGTARPGGARRPGVAHVAVADRAPTRLRTPIRAALLRYSTHGHELDLDGLVVADLGRRRRTPTARRASSARTPRSLAAAARARLVVALGGDNSITLPRSARRLRRVAADARGSSPSTPTTTCATASATARPYGGSSRPGSTARAWCRSGSPTSPTAASTPTAPRGAGITVIGRRRRGAPRHRRLHGRGARRRRSRRAARCTSTSTSTCATASVAPGCPASVPGGLSAYELRRAAFLLCADPRVSSLDLAEVDATADAPDARTVRLAALCVLEAAAGLASRA